MENCTKKPSVSQESGYRGKNLKVVSEFLDFKF